MKTRGMIFLVGLVVFALVVGLVLANSFIAQAQAGAPAPRPTPTSVESAPAPPAQLPTSTGGEKGNGASPPGPNPSPIVVTGPAGPSGSQGPRGIPGPPGPPPSDAQVQGVVDRVLASMDGAPVPAGYQPVLDLAVKQGFVVGYAKDGKSYRWQRRASRAEITLIVLRVWKDLDGKMGALTLRVEGLEGAVKTLQETDRRHDGQIKGLYGETRDLRQADQNLRGLIDWRTVALVLLLVVVGVGAALQNQN